MRVRCICLVLLHFYWAFSAVAWSLSRATNRRTVTLSPLRKLAGRKPGSRCSLCRERSLLLSVGSGADSMASTRNITIAKTPVAEGGGKTRLSTSRSNFTLRELQDSINLVDVIESQYQLDKFVRRGVDRATACCPFHNDHNPSLIIDTRRYKCFACGAFGNIFTFVQNYHNLDHPQNEMSFVQAVRIVRGVLLPRYQGYSAPRTIMPIRRQDGATRTQNSSIDISPRMLHRLREANMAAAAFYVDCLSRTYAGGARQHLFQRPSIAARPATIGEWCIGFAPDAYTLGTTWGKGSLVEHLRGIGFTPEEIVQAGLAKPTKRALENNRQRRNDNDSQDEIDGTEKIWGYASLMDRFRRRLMIPIFDTSGKAVVGFGGRTIPAARKKMVDFTPPKYLNSPETAIFEKSKILFGYHTAALARSSAELDYSPVIVVEGYMDAIALWSVGLRKVVATMGTSISLEQLELAANLSESRMILCLDNDPAGVAALERICCNGFLFNVTHRDHIVKVEVAELPQGTKDPADFVDEGIFRLGQSFSSQVAQEFVENILDKSLEWTDWYIQRLARSYDPSAPDGSAGSFPWMFQKVADFLAEMMTQSERALRISKISTTFEQVILQHHNMKGGNDLMLLEQFKSDLHISAMRIASDKEIKARSNKLSGRSLKNLLAVTSRGLGPTSDEDFDMSRSPGTKPSTSGKQAFPRQKLSLQTVSSQSRRSRKQADPPILTPHFAGFDFAHPADREWLKIANSKRRGRKDLILQPDSYPSPKSLLARGQNYVDEPRILQESAVYFNSNQYHGHRFLTESAVKAGYVSSEIIADCSFLEKGIGVFLRPDIISFVTSAELTLLKILLRSSRSRLVIKNLIDARSAISMYVELSWTNPDRKWLFSILTGDLGDRLPDVHSSGELVEAIKQLELGQIPNQVFGGLFSDCNSTISSISDDCERSENETSCSCVHACLDVFFDNHAGFPLVGDDYHLLAQEAYSTLAWVSTACRLEELKSQLSTSKDFLLLAQGNRSRADLPFYDRNYGLVEQIRDLTFAMRSLAESSKRITENVFYQRISTAFHGSKGSKDALAVAVDEHLDSTVEHTQSESPMAWKEHELLMHRIGEDWNKWLASKDCSNGLLERTSSERGKSESTSSLSYMALEGAEDEEEDLEESLARIEREWGKWL